MLKKIISHLKILSEVWIAELSFTSFKLSTTIYLMTIFLHFSKYLSLGLPLVNVVTRLTEGALE